MPYQLPDGRWRAHKMINGHRKTKIYSTKAEAKKWEVDQNETQWLEEERSLETPTACLIDMVNQYLDYSKLAHHPATYAGKKASFQRLFLDVEPMLAPEDLTPALLLKSITRTATTHGKTLANKDRKNYSAFWEHGVTYYGFDPMNPVARVKRLPEKGDNHYVPPVDDFWKVYNAGDDQDKAMLLTLLHTAGRRSTTLGLKMDDLKLAQKKIRLSSCKTRDGSRRREWLSMTSELAHALAQHIFNGHAGTEYVFVSKKTGEPYTTRKNFVKNLCKRAGVKEFGYHGIRGLSATILAQQGMPVKEIQVILMHASLSTTERYIRSLGVTTDRLGEAFANVTPQKKLVLETATSKTNKTGFTHDFAHAVNLIA